MDHFSVSQLNTYLACPLKYRLSYVDQIPKPFKPSGLALGSSLHAAIAFWHREMMKRGKPVDDETLLKVFTADFYAQALDKIQFGPKETEEGLLNMGEQLLKLYTQSFPPDNLKEAEMRFEVPLANPRTGEVLDLPLLGFMDQVRNDHTVVELKSQKRALDEASLHNHLQLTAYSYAYEHLFNQRPKLELVSLIKTKRPRVERLQTERGENDYSRFYLLAKGVLRGIEKRVFYPIRCWMCTDCQYQQVCHGMERLRSKDKRSVESHFFS